MSFFRTLVDTFYMLRYTTCLNNNVFGREIGVGCAIKVG